MDTIPDLGRQRWSQWITSPIAVDTSRLCCYYQRVRERVSFILSILIFFLFLCICMFAYVCVYIMYKCVYMLACGFMHIPYVCCAHGSEKRVSDCLILQIQTGVSLQAGARNQTWLRWKGSQHTQPRPISPAAFVVTVILRHHPVQSRLVRHNLEPPKPEITRMEQHTQGVQCWRASPGAPGCRASAPWSKTVKNYS